MHHWAELGSVFLLLKSSKVVSLSCAHPVKVWHKVCLNREECVRSDQLRYHVIVLFYFND